VKVTATGNETALAGIMRLVEQAQQSKSSTQILADKAAGWLFYVALGVAAIMAVAWTIAVGFNVDVIARVATVLMIACPHALGLVVPLVVAISTGIGARNGIFVRDRLALEKAPQIIWQPPSKATRSTPSLAASASRRKIASYRCLQFQTLKPDKGAAHTQKAMVTPYTLAVCAYWRC
jgi:hypothetical protein